jgi:hypothetical protein
MPAGRNSIGHYVCGIDFESRRIFGEKQQAIPYIFYIGSVWLATSNRKAPYMGNGVYDGGLFC